MATADSLSYLKKSGWVSRGFGTAELVWNYVLWLAVQTPTTLSAKQKRTCNQSWLGNSWFLSFPTVFLRFLIRSLWFSHASDWPLWLLWFGFTTLKRKSSLSVVTGVSNCYVDSLQRWTTRLQVYNKGFCSSLKAGISRSYITSPR